MTRFDTDDGVPLLLTAAARMIATSVKVGEVMVASGYVIGARMMLMGDAARNPLDADVDEFGRFVPEKISALSRSGAAWFDGACQVQRDLGDQLHDWGMLMLGGVPTPAKLAKLADESTRRGARVLMFPVETGDAAIAPVHLTVTANARRLRESQALREAA